MSWFVYATCHFNLLVRFRVVIENVVHVVYIEFGKKIRHGVLRFDMFYFLLMNGGCIYDIFLLCSNICVCTYAFLILKLAIFFFRNVQYFGRECQCSHFARRQRRIDVFSSHVSEKMSFSSYRREGLSNFLRFCSFLNIFI